MQHTMEYILTSIYNLWFADTVCSTRHPISKRLLHNEAVQRRVKRMIKGLEEYSYEGKFAIILS